MCMAWVVEQVGVLDSGQPPLTTSFVSFRFRRFSTVWAGMQYCKIVINNASHSYVKKIFYIYYLLCILYMYILVGSACLYLLCIHTYIHSYTHILLCVWIKALSLKDMLVPLVIHSSIVICYNRVIRKSSSQLCIRKKLSQSWHRQTHLPRSRRRAWPPRSSSTLSQPLCRTPSCAHGISNSFRRFL